MKKAEGKKVGRQSFSLQISVPDLALPLAPFAIL